MNIKKVLPVVLIAGFLLIAACMSSPTPTELPIPTPMTVELTQPPHLDPKYFLTATLVPFVTLAPTSTFEGTPAIVNIALNMGAG
ncbi:MAG TPA: hypothetical protein PLT08_09565, partial [Anaerolineales bacterium]|nr:hypothetical protein [Anaerolineales bacterium]